MNKTLYNLMNWPDIEGVVYSDLQHPKSLLGSTKVKKGMLLQTFYPDAVKAYVKKEDNTLLAMEMADEAGFFAVLDTKEKESYKHSFVFGLADGSEIEISEVYDTPSLLKSEDKKLFASGDMENAYELLGAHIKTVDGVKGTLFAVWAPFAWRVSVVGDFNHWDGRMHMMELDEESGIYELFIPGVQAGDLYKFEIRQKGGYVVLKNDPYARACEAGPNHAGIVTEDAYSWNDASFITKRDITKGKKSPVSVLEINLKDFVTEEDTGYRDFAAKVVELVRESQYTHVALMPVMEYPKDETLGYHVSGYYAPTARYGKPQDLKCFVDMLHQAGIPVIMDWTPAQFAKEECGMGQFDGTCLYEHQDPRQGEHPWGTLIFNYGRPEVSSFLISNAFYWIREFHMDGIRMDALALMLYLDYDKQPGQWIANIYGGNENLDAIAFIRKLNDAINAASPEVLLIADDSTAWPKVTASTAEDGLGFDYKGNKGWSHDLMYFMECDPLFRKGRYHSLTFSMVYAYSENFILGLGHDVTCTGEASLLERMPGETKEERLANLRVAYAYMMTHPGKKLLYRGEEAGLGEYIADLNKLYRKEPALYELDFDTDGFEWVNDMAANECIVSFIRRAADGEELLVIANFTPVAYNKYKVGVPGAGKYKEIFNSDSEKYGGLNVTNKRAITSKEEACDARENSIRVNVPPMGVTVLRRMELPVKNSEQEKKAPAEKTVKKTTAEKKTGRKTKA